MEIEPLRGRSKLVAKRLVAKRLGLSVAVDQIGVTSVMQPMRPTSLRLRAVRGIDMPERWRRSTHIVTK